MGDSEYTAAKPQHGELIKFLQDMIRIDTTNPPGKETPVCEYVKKVLAAEGIESEIYESEPGRGNLVARLRGDGSKRPLMLTAHIDVVPAEAEMWSVPPFSGEIKDGFLWGRGSLDCKNQLAVELEIFLELKRKNIPLKRDIILLAVCDEEQNGTHGMEFMADQHFDKIDCEFSINEGGGIALPLEGKNIYMVSTAEKGVGWYRLTTHGSPGHGSVPKADNALVKMGRALMRLSHPQPVTRTAIVAETLNGIASLMPFPKNALLPLIFNPVFSDTVLGAIKGINEDFADMVSASLRDTVSATMIEAGYKENVIPATCKALVDCRILPGQTHERFMKILKDVSGVDEIEQVNKGVPQPTENKIDTELYRVIKKVMPKHDSNAVVLPLMMTGATDSRFLREKGVTALGFLPMNSRVPVQDYISTIHGIDERVPLDGLVFSYDALYDIVLEIAG